MKPKRVLDSYAVLAYLQGERGREAVISALAEPGLALMNEINVGEVFYILAKTRGPAQADFFLGTILPQLPITIVGNSFDDVIAATRIKAEHPLAYANCFAVSTAQKEGARLLTGDPEFASVASLITIEWIR